MQEGGGAIGTRQPRQGGASSKASQREGHHTLWPTGNDGSPKSQVTSPRGHPPPPKPVSSQMSSVMDRTQHYEAMSPFHR